MDERLHELLDIWVEQREQGVQLALADLCALRAEWFAETPELRDELQSAMRQLEAFRRDILDPTAFGHSPETGPEALPVIENYRVDRLAGVGGMGRVYLAQDEQLGLTVAIKVLDTGRGLLAEADRRRLAKRFVQEARMLAALSHPHIVRVFAGKPKDDRPYFAMEYLPRSLAEPAERARLRQAGPRATAEFMVKVAEAVQYAHEHDVLHRDLKPANILIDRQGEPKVCDFGLAKLAQEAEEGTSATPMSPTIEGMIDETAGPLTRAGHQPGTPAYMAPEQHDPTRGPVDARADLWALGVILYELLTGRKPFSGEDRDTLRQEVLAAPLAPRRLRKDLPCDLEMICLKCLEAAPARRYETCQQLADDLRRFLLGVPTLARPRSAAVRVVQWVRRRPVGIALVSLASLAVLAAVALPGWLAQRDQENNEAIQQARTKADFHKAQAEERDWLARNDLYVAQILRTWDLHQQGKTELMRELLQAQRPQPGQKDVRGFEWRYLRRLTRADFVLREHKSQINALAYSQDGQRCAAGAEDGTIKIWEVETGRMLMTLDGQSRAVNQLRFAANDTRLYSANWSRQGDEGVVGDLRVWDLSARKTVLERGPYRHKGTVGIVFGIALAREAPYAIVICAGDNGGIVGVNLETGDEQVLDSSELILSADVSPDARLIAIAQGNLVVRLRNPTVTPAPAEIQQRNWTGIANVNFSADGKLLAIGRRGPLNNFVIDVWDVASRTRRQLVTVKNLPAICEFDASGHWLAAIDVVDPVKHGFYLWNLTQGILVDSNLTQGILVDSESDSNITTVTFSPSGREIAVGRRNGSVHFRETWPVGESFLLPGPAPKSEAWCVAFSPDGKTLAAGYDHEDGKTRETAKLWNPVTQQGKTLSGHRAAVMALAISPDGKVLATASYDGTIRLWDMASGENRTTLQGHTKPVRALAFSPDGAVLVSGGTDQSISMTKAADGALVNSWRGHNDNVRALAFAPDGRRFFSAGNDSLIKIWKADDQTLVSTIKEEGKIQGLACSPSGSLLASATETNNVNLWDVVTGAPVKSLRGHTGKVRAVAFSPDGKTLASGGQDNTVRLWQVATGQEMLALPVEHFVNGLAFDRQGKTLAAALHNGRVKIWPAQ